MTTRRKRPQIVLTLDPASLARLDAESSRTGLPRARIVDALLARVDLAEVLDADESDPGRWLVTGPDGRVQSAGAWAAELGIPAVTIRHRLRQGYSDEKALSVEALPTGRPRKASS